MKTLLLWSALFSALSFANDGFFQGAGQTLLPINEPNLFVHAEELDITPVEKETCYEVLYQGKKVESFKSPLGENALGELKGPRACAKSIKGPSRDVFVTQFHAKAKYVVEAKENVKDVQMGFPVPVWSYEWDDDGGINYLSVPGAVNFETTLEEKPISILSTKWVELPDPWSEEHKKKIAPAYLWKASFEKGKTVTLTSEYDFGGDESVTFFDRHLPEGTVPWWDESTAVEAKYGNGGIHPVFHIRYFLSPIGQWGPPVPKKIRARVHRAKNIPIFYYLPNTRGLRCIDKDTLHFEWNNELPPDELFVNYPDKTPKLKSFKTQAQFLAWASAISQSNGKNATYMGTVQVTCDLIDDVIKKLGPKSYVAGWFPKEAPRKCVPGC